MARGGRKMAHSTNILYLFKRYLSRQLNIDANSSMRIPILFILIFLLHDSSEFTEETLTFSVQEDAPIGKVIGRIDGKPGYTFRVSRSNSKIDFDDRTLEIKTNAHLDREEQSEIELLLISTPPSIVHIRVEILDVNDNAPAFTTQCPQQVTIPETAPPGWHLTINGASDPDVGENGRIVGYRLEPNDKFEIVQDEGVTMLELKSKLDRESVDFYSINLTATDGGQPSLSSSCLINIVVLDTNDNPPNFGVRLLEIEWNGVAGAEILHLNATDADDGDNARIVYRILPDGVPFSIVNDSMVIATNNETECVFEFTVEARDSGNPPLISTLDVVVRVLNSNQHDPNINIRFYPSEFDFVLIHQEDINGKTVAILSVTDSDGPLGKNSSIRLESGNEDNIFGLISRASINILTLRHVENAVKEKYELVFVANDGQGPTERKSRKTLKIFFEKFAKERQIDLAEKQKIVIARDVASGSFVTKISGCEDCQFEIISNESPFRIDSENGIIMTSTQLPPDISSYRLKVRESSIIDSSNSSEIIKLSKRYQIWTHRKATSGSVIGKLPKPMTSQQIYSITRNHSDIPFGIFPDGTIYALRNLMDAEEFYMIEITLKFNSAIQTSVLSIQMRNSNENSPKCGRELFKISENREAGTLIGFIEASDDDNGANGVVSYNQLDSEHLIYIESISGKIFARKSFDAEQIETIKFRYSVRDYGNPIKETKCEAIIEIIDQNDNIPHFGFPYFSANLSIGPLVTVSATDLDRDSKNNKIEYRLINFLDYFEIDKSNGTIFCRNTNIEGTRVNLTIEAVNVDSSDFLYSTSFVLIGNNNEKSEYIDMKSSKTLRIFSNDIPGTRIKTLEFESKSQVFWKSTDDSFFVDSRGNIILEKQPNKSLKKVKMISGIRGSKFRKTFEFNIEYLKESRPGDDDNVIELKMKEMNETGKILELEGFGWNILRIIGQDSFEVRNSSIFGSISNMLTEEVKFLTSNVLMLLSSSHSIGTSFGRVTAESAHPIRYFITGTDQISIDSENGELILRERFFDNLNDIIIVAVIPTGIAKTKVTVEVVEDHLHLSKTNFVVFVPRNIKIGVPIDRIDVGRHNVMIDIIDAYFYVRKDQIYSKRLYNNGSNPRFYEIQGIVKKGKLTSEINITMVFEEPTNSNSNLKENELVYSIEENRAIGSVVGMVPNAKNAKYRLIDSTAGISIDDNGIVRTTEVFDRENTGVIKTKMIEANAHRIWDILIFVDDLNDNPPFFTHQIEKLNIRDDTFIGKVVHRLSWNDFDSDANEFFIEIVDGDPFDCLEINDHGEIRLKRKLTSNFNATFRLYDSKAPFTYNFVESTIEFTILRSNPPIPKCSNTSFVLFGKPPSIGEKIGKVMSDMDQVVFRIRPESLKDSEFAIDAMSGEIETRKLITDDIEMIVEVLTYDEHPSIGFCTIHIKVSQIVWNEDFHFVNNSDIYQFSIKETADRGSQIAQVRTTSLNVLYSLEPSNSNFTISPFDGIISTNSFLDYEQTREYLLNVTVTNLNTDEIIKKSVKIKVIDENDESPRFITGDTVHLKIAENSPISYPAIIGSSIAEDLDEGQNGIVTYSIVVGNTSAFAINSTSGDILCLYALDREDIDEYELIVEARDVGSPPNSATSKIIVSVEDANDNFPVFRQSAYFEKLVENAKKGVRVVQVFADDKDEGMNAQIRYSLLNGSSTFDIDEIDGWITVASEIDRETNQEFEVIVEARDEGVPPKRAQVPVRIQIVDENDNLPILNSKQFEIFVPNDARKNDFLMVLNASDADSNDILTFKIDGLDKGYFKINDDAEIVCEKPLIAKSYFSIEAIATDRAGHSIVANITFHLQPREKFPKWIETIENVKVKEHERQQIAIFNAKLGDIPIKYSLISHCQKSFTIDETKGVLSSTAFLDRESNQRCPIWITATAVSEGIPLTTTTKTIIEVIDVNDNSPRFEKLLYEFNLTENAGPVTIGTLRADDLDSGANAKIVYRIIEGDPMHEFLINENGELESIRDLDREYQSKYRLIVEARDNGKPSLSSTCIVIINVLDEDDNAPRFSRIFHVEIPEDTPTGSFVIQLSASDIDERSDYVFSFESPDDDLPFSLESHTGKVYTKSALDFEKKSSYRIKIRLTDGIWSIETSLFVTLSDVNDNSPAFDKSEYLFLVNDSTNIGAVFATDQDSDENGHVLYSIHNSNKYLRIDHNSGNIMVVRDDIPPLIEATIIAADNGIPTRRTSVKAIFIFLKYWNSEKMLIDKNIKLDTILPIGPSFNIYPKLSVKRESEKFYLKTRNESIVAFDRDTRKLVVFEFVERRERKKVAQIIRKSIRIPIGFHIGDYLAQFDNICDHFELGNRTDFAIDLSGNLRIIQDFSNSTKFSLMCNDGIWPKMNFEVAKVEIEMEKVKKHTGNNEPKKVVKSSRIITLPIHSRIKIPSLASNNSIVLEIPQNSFIGPSFGFQIEQNYLKLHGDFQKNSCFELFSRRSYQNHFDRVFLDVSIDNNAETWPVFDKTFYEFNLREDAQIGTVVQDFSHFKNHRLQISENHQLCEIANKIVLCEKTQPGVYHFEIELIGPEKKIRSAASARLTVVPVPFHSPSHGQFPSVIYVRELSKQKVVAKLPNDSNATYHLSDDNLRNIFEISEQGLLKTRIDSRAKTVYRVPIAVENGGEKNLEMFRIFVDEQIENRNNNNASDVDIIVIDTGENRMIERIGQNCEEMRNEEFEKIAIHAVNEIVDDFEYELSMAIVDRNGIALDANESRRTLKTFIERTRPQFLDVDGIETDFCKNVICRNNQTCRPSVARNIERFSAKYQSKILNVPLGTIRGKCGCAEGKECEEIAVAVEKKLRKTMKIECGKGEEAVDENGEAVCYCEKGFESKLSCSREMDMFSISKGFLEIQPKPENSEICSECNGTQKLEFDFRTIAETAQIVLFEFSKQTISIEIKAGQIVFALFDSYSRPVEIYLERVINDGKWHRLLLQMRGDGKKTSIQIDGRGKEVKSRIALPLPYSAGRILVGNVCLRRVLAQNQLVHPEIIQNKFFVISPTPFLDYCSNDSKSSSVFAKRTTICLVIALLILASIAMFACILVSVRKIRRKCANRDEPCWKKATEIDAYAVRGHVNRSMSKSSDDNYEIASIYCIQTKYFAGNQSPCQSRSPFSCGVPSLPTVAPTNKFWPNPEFLLALQHDSSSFGNSQPQTPTILIARASANDYKFTQGSSTSAPPPTQPPPTTPPWNVFPIELSTPNVVRPMSEEAQQIAIQIQAIRNNPEITPQEANQLVSQLIASFPPYLQQELQHI
ncbi:unnamed protein product [Caenorhabditis bovis]|uniref:Uncharacterized protein n=1 Tax=Caenorhabditis bovis TaxID=2654633 RepID=A0A8S1EW96_9PELO|nr:unnamed protein product [Caenorhabditis bovis]